MLKKKYLLFILNSGLSESPVFVFSEFGSPTPKLQHRPSSSAYRNLADMAQVAFL